MARPRVLGVMPRRPGCSRTLGRAGFRGAPPSSVTRLRGRHQLPADRDRAVHVHLLVHWEREPARAALGELKTGAEKAWGELKAALDSAITKFREPS